MLNKERQEQRLREWKRGTDIEESRRKREESSIRIRKNKREENLQKRRNIQSFSQNPTYFVDSTIAERLKELPQLIVDISSNDISRQIEATSKVRKLLSIEKSPPIQEVIDANLVPKLVEFLKYNDQPQLQFEAAWALTNVASGTSEQTRTVLEANAVPHLVSLLSSAHDDVREQAVWALGNIAGDSPAYRDFVLSHGVMEPLLHNLVESNKLSMLRNATWTLSNLCRGKPQPPWEIVSKALPTLARLIYSTDEEVLTDACWALSYLSDGPNDHIQAVIEAGVCRRLAELLMHGSYSVQTPALRTIGNMVTGDDLQTQIVLNVSILPCLLSLLSSPKKGIRKEACWTISNITAGNRSQIQAVIDAGLIPPLLNLLQTAEFDIRKEAAWAISNATSGGSPDQLRYLIAQGAVPPLCDLLELTDARIVMVALEALDNLLRVGEKDAQRTGNNEVAEQIEECHGLDKIMNLQRHRNTEIYQKAFKILESYFETEEDQNMTPNAIPEQQIFQFGTASNIPQTFKF
jgi:importin subunit alpha-1